MRDDNKNRMARGGAIAETVVKGAIMPKRENH